jgi:thymidylate kinase
MIDSHPSSFFLTFEGIDGGGKSTHLEAVRNHFEAQGRRWS